MYLLTTSNLKPLEENKKLFFQHASDCYMYSKTRERRDRDIKRYVHVHVHVCTQTHSEWRTWTLGDGDRHIQKWIATETHTDNTDIYTNMKCKMSWGRRGQTNRQTPRQQKEGRENAKERTHTSISRDQLVSIAYVSTPVL